MHRCGSLVMWTMSCWTDLQPNGIVISQRLADPTGEPCCQQICSSDGACDMTEAAANHIAAAIRVT